MLEPTEYEIEPLVGGDRVYTAVTVRSGRAWLGVPLTNPRDGTEYVHVPVGYAAKPVPAPPDWQARIGRPLYSGADVS